MNIEDFFKVIEPPKDGLKRLNNKMGIRVRRRTRIRNTTIISFAAVAVSALLFLGIFPKPSILDAALEQDDLLVYQLHLKPVKSEWVLDP